MTSGTRREEAAAPARRSLRPRSGRKGRAALILASAAAASAVLAGWLYGDDSRVEHVNGEGPLQSDTAQGTTSVYAPREVPWAVTFGSYLLCSTTGEPITLDGVRYNTAVEPRSVSLKLRTVTPRMWKASVDAGYIGAALGEPPHFDKRKAPGHYADVRAGSRITQSCAEQDREGAGYTELLFVLDVGEQGGVIDAAWIDYHVGGKPYTLRLDWKMVACGTKVPEAVDGTAVCDGEQG